MESSRKISHNQPFQDVLMNGMNKHQNNMHNTEESEKFLDDTEAPLTPINQRRDSHHDIQT